MKTNKHLVLRMIKLTFIVLFLSSCSQIMQHFMLSNCEFRVRSIQLNSIDNVSLTNITSPSGLSALNIASLTNSLLRGSLPLTYTALIDIKNPNSTNAAMNSFDLIVLLNNVEIAQSKVNKHVEILANKTATVPITLTSDIAHIFKQENITQILRVLFPGENSSSALTFKIKPSIRVGPATINYPGYITLTHTFKSK